MQVFIPGQDLEVRIIASIWPQKIEAKRPLYSGDFTIPAVNKGDAPRIKVIEHHIQYEREPITHRQRPETILSWQIANDLINQWANNGLLMNHESGPGIWILQLPDGRYPDPNNPAQIQAAIEHALPEMHERQGRYFGRLIESGDLKATDEHQKRGITSEEKLAAQYMGYDKPWLHDIKHGDMKTCQFCSKSNPSGALVCQFCQQVIDPEGFALAAAMRDKVLEDTRKALVADHIKAPLPPLIQPSNKGVRA